MDKALDMILQAVQSDLQKNLDASKKGKLADSSEPQSIGGGGKERITFHLDGDGNAKHSLEKYGAGVTVHITAFWIESPDAIYTIKISSSDGGGGTWNNVHINEKHSCTIHTSVWHSTKITVTLHANVANKDGVGWIEYSY
jgi:hypothetical protein